MKASDLRAKDGAGIDKEITDLLKAHFGLRMQKATQQLTNHSQLKRTRREIARAKTIRAEQKRAAAAGAPAPVAKPAKQVVPKRSPSRAPKAAKVAAPPVAEVKPSKASAAKTSAKAKGSK